MDTLLMVCTGVGVGVLGTITAVVGVVLILEAFEFITYDIPEWFSKRKDRRRWRGK